MNHSWTKGDAYLELIERFSESLHCFDVQVICRFVQNEEIRTVIDRAEANKSWLMFQWNLTGKNS